jgi:hypothetical protein
LYHLGYKNFSSNKGKNSMRINLEMNEELYNTITSIKQAEENIGGLSNTSKMPALSTGISVDHCDNGSVLIEVDGSACFGCYADGGRYNMPNVKDALAKRFDKYKENSELWICSIVYILRNSKLMQRVPFFRWFDSGDLIDFDHLIAIYTVVANTPTISHWLPSKEWNLIKMVSTLPNLVTRLSSPFKNKPFKPNHTPTHSVVLTQAEFDRTIDKADETGIFYCPAYSQDGECKDCRACWNPEIECVAYRFHGSKKHGNSKMLLDIEKITSSQGYRI